jgi:riboflavin kinase/FMN adenylyltransferase
MATKLIRFLYNVTTAQQGGVITIGNFDGMHIGHQQLLAKTVAKAKTLGVPSIAVTFEPHAFEYFSAPNVNIPRLTRLREKFCALAETGVDTVLILNFNQELANISASDFVNHIIVGDDFRFGHQRLGNIALLTQMGAELGFTTEALTTVMLGGERVSSTRVRATLAKGDHVLVAQLLGHPYAMMGRVRRGDQRGRTLGFPTANIYLHRHLTPVRGVYSVLLHGIEGKARPGVANIGVRPTVDGTRTLLEVHLLDFNQDIYGCYVQVEFCEKIRDEARYPNLDLLKQQIAKDVATARDYFNKNGVL